MTFCVLRGAIRIYLGDFNLTLLGEGEGRPKVYPLRSLLENLDFLFITPPLFGDAKKFAVALCAGVLGTIFCFPHNLNLSACESCCFSFIVGFGVLDYSLIYTSGSGGL